MLKETREEIKLNVFVYLGMANKPLYDELCEEYRSYRDLALELKHESIDAYLWIVDKIKFERK